MINFVSMKKIRYISSFLFGLIVFFALLLQSVHSFCHLVEASSREKCHHNYSEKKAQITHSHDFENCFTCEFTFSTSIKSEDFCLSFNTNHFFSNSSFFRFKNVTSFFCGSLFSLRAPPNLIV